MVAVECQSGLLTDSELSVSVSLPTTNYRGFSVLVHQNIQVHDDLAARSPGWAIRLIGCLLNRGYPLGGKQARQPSVTVLRSHSDPSDVSHEVYGHGVASGP